MDRPTDVMLDALLIEEGDWPGAEMETRSQVGSRRLVGLPSDTALGDGQALGEAEHTVYIERNRRFCRQRGFCLQTKVGCRKAGLVGRETGEDSSPASRRGGVDQIILLRGDGRGAQGRRDMSLPSNSNSRSG